LKLKDKVALVTGATQGIGVAIVERLAEDGARVVFTGRREDKGREVERILREKGHEVTFVQSDVSIEEQVKDAVEQTVARYGGLNVLVNNAAATDIAGAGKEDSHVDELDTRIWDQTFRVAAYGTMWMCKYSIPHMRRAGGGSIINITASSSIRAISGRPSYQSSKGAVNNLTRHIAIDYGAEHIRCNAVIVGFINTGEEVMRKLLANEAFREEVYKIIPAGRLGVSRDIANAVLFFASDDSDFVNGTLLAVDGGMGSRLPTPDTSSKKLLD
jgi:3-oxoacyl-[acyl-carrier protein] reductase